MAADTRAVVSRTSLDVSDLDANTKAQQLMKHATGAAGGLFPQSMTLPQAVQIARLSIGYNLDPFAEELILYQGKPYLTIKGAMRLANVNPAYEGVECQPATDAERQAFRCREDEHLWVARVYRRDRRVPIVGYGRAGGASDKNPVSNTYAQEMAQKRAKHRALRDAFSLPLDSYEDVSDAPRLSGEIIEGEVVELADVQPMRPSVDDAPADDSGGEAIEAGVTSNWGPAIIPGADEAPARASHGQIQNIKILMRGAQMKNEEYRQLLSDCFGVTSSKDLTQGQAAAFAEVVAAEIQALHAKGKAPRAIGPEEYARIKAHLASWHEDALSPEAIKARQAERAAAKAATQAQGESPLTDDERAAYTSAMMDAADLSLDLTPFETTDETTTAQFRVINSKLQAAVVAATPRTDVNMTTGEIPF